MGPKGPMGPCCGSYALVEQNPMILAILIDQLQYGKVASVSRNIVHLFVSKLFLLQAQQYPVPLVDEKTFLLKPLPYSLSNGPDCPVWSRMWCLLIQCWHLEVSPIGGHTLHIHTALIHTVLPHSLPSIPLVWEFPNSNHLIPSLYFFGS